MVPISYSVRSLFVRKATTVATALGIALVVFVLASSMMLSKGIQKTLAAGGKPENAIVLRTGSDAEMTSSIDSQTAKIVMESAGIKRSSTGPLAVGELVVVAALDKVGQDGKVSNVQVRGVDEHTVEFRSEVRIVAGRPARMGTDEVMIGQRIRGRFAGLELGSSFELKNNRPVKVVGVFSAGGSSFESEIWADLETVRSAFGRPNLVSSVTVQLENPDAFAAFAARIESDKRLGLDASRETAFYEKQSEGTSIFIMALGITIAVFFSFGAMIGAMITMYGAVAQRRREIGTLRALGFSRISILVSFLIESFALALIGGAVGSVFALAMGMVEFSMMNFMTWSEIVFSFDPDPATILTALMFGALMGVLGGFFPALRAARTSPIEAMRG